MPPKKNDANVTFTAAPTKPYLLSSRTRAQLATSSSSSALSAPDAAAMSVPSAPVMAESSSSSLDPSPSLNAVSTEVMKQVTIMLRQHDAELTSRVDMMMNSASTSNTNDSPTVTLQDGTTLHDYDEETGMHAHDSPHASRVSDEEDEFKY